MTISSISDLLALGWAHAYCTEGPRFTALSYSDGVSVSAWPDEMASAGTSGLTVGWMSLSGGVGDTTGDLAQATSGKRPVYRASSASMNSKPIVEFDGTDDNLVSSAWTTALSMPNYIYVVARLRTLTGSAVRILSSCHITQNNAHKFGWTSLAIYRIGGGNGSATGGTANTNAHAFRYVVNESTHWKLYVDESLIIDDTSNLGVETASGLSLGGDNSASPVFAPADVAFWGIKDTALSAGDITDLDSFATTHWGTP